MSEEEYICATNRVKISLVLSVLRDVLPGDNYGISSDELSVIMARLYTAEEELFNSFKVVE